jgi:hypothetical protein
VMGAVMRTGVGHQSHSMAHHAHLVQTGLAVEQHKTGSKFKGSLLKGCVWGGNILSIP